MMWPKGMVGRPPASPVGRGPVPQRGWPLKARCPFLLACAAQKQMSRDTDHRPEGPSGLV